MRPSLAVSALVLVLACAPAQAQAPLARPALVPTARAAALLAPALEAALAVEAARNGATRRPAVVRGDSVVADTTGPWRYFPLHVGDAWEYHEFTQGFDSRYEVTGEEEHEGRRYAHVRGLSNGGLVRFDTATARVMDYNWGAEVPIEPCALDAPFGGSVLCRDGEVLFDVRGGYDQLLVLGSPPDTAQTAVKIYDAPGGYYEIIWYAADIGKAYRESEWILKALYYVRVRGVEYGTPRYAPAAEPRPAPGDALALAVRPNPARGSATAAFVLAASGAIRAEVYDGLGRRVRVLDLGRLGAGRHEVSLDLAGLPPGVYALRLATPDAAATRLLTVIE